MWFLKRLAPVFAVTAALTGTDAGPADARDLKCGLFLSERGISAGCSTRNNGFRVPRYDRYDTPYRVQRDYRSHGGQRSGLVLCWHAEQQRPRPQRSCGPGQAYMGPYKR